MSDIGPIDTRGGKVRIGVGHKIAAWFASKGWRSFKMLLHSPFGLVCSLLISGGWVTWAVLSRWVVIASAIAGLVALASWRKRAPYSFDRHVKQTLRGLWRGWLIYRWRWGRIMKRSEVPHNKGNRFPLMTRFRSTEFADYAEFDMLDGQRKGDYQPVADRMNTTIKGLGATVLPVPEKHAKRLRIEVLVRDPLIENARVPVRPPITEPLPRRGVDVATIETGDPFLLRLLGQNTLIGAESGMGKGGAFWSIVDGHHPALESGLMIMWGIDNKGQELRQGKHLFARLVDGGTALDACHMTEDALDFLRDRRSRVGDRFLTPTLDEPLLVLAIDELAALSAWVTDPKIKRRLATAMGLLLSQDRSGCVSVLGMLQDPSKDVLPQRGLYQNVIAGRIPGSLVGGIFKDKDAYLKGAKCPDIPRSTPGVFYAEVEGREGYPRIRFRWRTDEDIELLPPVAPIIIQPSEPRIYRRVPRFGGFTSD